MAKAIGLSITRRNELDHKGLAKMYGYCLEQRNTTSLNVAENGIKVIWEYGTDVYAAIKTCTWQQRIRHVKELVDLLIYLENSPIGSLRISDFKDIHFMYMNNSIKAIDFEDLKNEEPLCSSQNPCEEGYGIVCDNGSCTGYNAEWNMRHTRDTLLRNLLLQNVEYPDHVRNELLPLLHDIDRHEMSTAEWKMILENIHILDQQM